MAQILQTTRLPRKDLFGHASDRLMELLDSVASDVSLRPGETLFEQGDEGDTLYVVVQGLLEVAVTSVEGRKRALDVIGPGDIVGEIAFFDPGERTASITAREKTRVLSIARSGIERAVAQDPSLWMDLMHMVAQRLRWVSQQLHEQVFLPLPERLARKLLHLTSNEAEADTQVLRMSQNDLAEFVGASREAVSKTLALWRQEEVIDLGRQKVIVQDRDALRELAGFDLL